MFSLIIIANICVALAVCQTLCFVGDPYVHLVLITTYKYALLLSHFRVEETKSPKQWAVFSGNSHPHPTKQKCQVVLQTSNCRHVILDFIHLLRQSPHLTPQETPFQRRKGTSQRTAKDRLAESES